MARDKKKRIVIACQGGGSHTAFTAGALKRILLHLNSDYRIVGLSGTSGGAICALLAWYGLLKRKKKEWTREEAAESLESFWMENATRGFWESTWNMGATGLRRLQAGGQWPEWKVSPYSLPFALGEEMIGQSALRKPFFDLRELIERHVKLEEVRDVVTEEPKLLVGAVDVRSGEFQALDSHSHEIDVHAILASAAVPWMFRAVEFEGKACWDGLFSQNPPIREFVASRTLDEKPDEIWVIWINPLTREHTPRLIGDIEDRRNELIGNVAIKQELYFIDKVNDWLASRELKPRKKKKQIILRHIRMCKSVSASLDYPSKLNRSRRFIASLIKHGEKKADYALQEAAGLSPTTTCASRKEGAITAEATR